MSGYEEDDPGYTLTDRFCIFKRGERSVYINLHEIEAVIEANGGAIVSMKSGSDIPVDNDVESVLFCIVSVSDTYEGDQLREKAKDLGIDVAYMVGLGATDE